MKQYIKSLFLVAIAAAVTACGMDKLSTPEHETDSEKGYLQIGSLLVNGDTENTIISPEKNISRAASEADGSFFIEVIHKTTGAAAWSGNYAELKGQTIGLEPGTYVVYAYQTQAKTPAMGVAANAPYYAGQSEDIEIVTKQTASTTVTCRLANILTTVELSADLKAVFKPYEATSEKRLKTNVKVGSDAVTNEYDFEASSTHEAPLVYFADVVGPNNASGNTMTIALSGDYYTGDPIDVIEGRADESKWKEVRMVKTVTNVRAAQWRKISIDIDHNTTGDVKFEFVIESYAFDEEIVVDVVTLYESLNIEESIPDDEEENPAAPDVTINGQEGLNFAINESIYDADAEMWTSTLKLNITPKDGSSVASIYAVFTSTNASLLSAMAEKGFAEGRIDLFPTNAASDYATTAADGTTITLKAAGMDALYKYSGTHTASVYTIDSQNRMKHTDVIITVSAGSTGNGPTVVWMKNGVDVIDQWHSLTSFENYDAAIDITSETGVTGMYVDINAEKLTPEELANFGLAQHMNLLEPESAQMESGLRSLGFLPTESGDRADAFADDNYRIYYPDAEDGTPGARKEGKVSPLYMQKALTFKITEFTGMLWALYGGEKGDAIFTLTVEDAGGKTVKEVKFHIE